MKRARCFLRLVLSAPGVVVTGCLIPYAYPKLDYVSGFDTNRKTACTAFRVDTTAAQADLGETGEFTLTEIPQRGAFGTISPQTRLSCERGYYVFGIALNYNVGQFHDTRVRLYRPGYQLVELQSGDSPDTIRWQPAADWAAQEQALDDLLTRPVLSSVPRRRKSPGELAELPQVTASSETTRVFVLAAGEYERVAALAPAPADAARLRNKAKQLVEIKPASTGPVNGTGTRPTSESP